MSSKHNRPHPERGPSNYKRRLEARGLKKAPELKPLDVLRRQQPQPQVVVEIPAMVLPATRPGERRLSTWSGVRR